MRWIAIAAIFVAVQLCIAAGLAVHVGYHEAPPLGKYGNAAAFPVLFVLAGMLLWRLRVRPENPIEYLRQQDWSQMLAFAAAMTLVWGQFTALTWMKAMIPHVTTMWADPMLASFEATLLSDNAYRFLPTPGPVIDYAYALWFPVLTVSFAIAFFRLRERRDATFLAFFLTVGLLGVFGQYVLPSGGPIYFERLGFGKRFAGMEIPELAARTSDYLWIAYNNGSIGFASGISAFPSIHVATSAWIAIALRHWLAYAFLAMIFIGSIMLGWHYAIDGVAGVLGALACFGLANLIVAARGKAAPVRTAKLG